MLGLAGREEWNEYTLDEIYPHRAGKGPVVHGVGDVASVIGKSSFDIVVHAPPRAEDSIASPAGLVVEGVRVRGRGWIFSAVKHDDDDDDDDDDGNITRLRI